MIFAVFNDARYNMVYHGFKFSFGREEHLGQTDYIDFVKFAGALGIKGYVIDKPGQINKQLISEAFKSNRPVILDIRIDKSVRIAGAGRVEVLKHMGES
jgi:acetolactate synthase-1/2/3 large subunit